MLVLWEQVHWRCTMSKGGGLLIMCPCTCKLLSLYMQTTVSVHVNAGYCPRTCRQATVPQHAGCLWFSHSLYIGRQRSTSCFFSNPHLVLEKASQWTWSSPESAKLAGQQEYKQHPPVSASSVLGLQVCPTVAGFFMWVPRKEARSLGLHSKWALFLASLSF